MIIEHEKFTPTHKLLIASCSVGTCSLGFVWSVWLIYLQPVRLWNPEMRKNLVLLQVLAILIAEFQYGMRAAGQDEGITSSRIRFYPYLTARYVPISKTAWGLFKLIPITQTSICLVKWNSVLILCISLSRIPLGGSGVDEWLETTGQMNRAHVHVRRRRKYQRMPPWMVFCLILIVILYTYRKVS